MLYEFRITDSNLESVLKNLFWAVELLRGGACLARKRPSVPARGRRLDRWMSRTGPIL
jgi:hypothetical protein